MSMAELGEFTAIDPWFLAQIEDLVAIENDLKARAAGARTRPRCSDSSARGFPMRGSASCWDSPKRQLRAHRKSLGIKPVFKRVDTCAAEFPSATAYMYSTYEEECEATPSDRRKIMVLGGGPNRIGQGIEFDYCCVHAALAMREDGYETIMVNCNPETVSTDYDTSDRLYFEPVTLEDVLAIVEVEKPTGVIVQFGGQTPLKLVDALQAEGVPIIGTSADAIDQAEDRERFQQMIDEGRLAAAGESHRRDRRSRHRSGRHDRLSDGGAAVVRARRPRDGSGAQQDRSGARICATRSWCRTLRRCCSTIFSIRRSRSTSTRCATASRSSSARSCSTSSRPVCTLATRRVRCRRIDSRRTFRTRFAAR